MFDTSENPKAQGLMLNSDEVHLFSSILEIESCTYDDARMKAFVKGFAVGRGLDVHEDNGNLYIRKGVAEVYPTIVAHLDTVHEVRDDGRYRVAEWEGLWYALDPVSGRQVGVGGDDKVGIFVALQLLVTEPALKVALFRDEEYGCIGSKKFDLSFFADSAFVLQCDRRGNRDFVNTISGVDLYSKEFGQAIATLLKEHGYSPTSGGMTDVLMLAEGKVGCCVANMSAGYFDPHCDLEWIREADVVNVLSLVEGICRTHGHRRWEHVAPKRKSYFGGGWGGWNGWKKTSGDRLFTQQQWDEEIRQRLEPLPAVTWVTEEEEEIKHEKLDCCPLCFAPADEKGGYAAWDEFEDDWFCFTCGDYFSINHQELLESEAEEAKFMALA